MSSVSTGSYGKIVPVNPPLKGSFPLDYHQICKLEMVNYMLCLQSKGKNNELCRAEAKNYFKCRMENELMDKESWARLGYGDLEEAKKDATKIIDSKTS